jgi:hypothetical protein
MKLRRPDPEIVLRNGKAAAVILDIAQYEDLLERVEDTHDLARLRAMRATPVHYKKLDDFLRGRQSRV